MTVLPFVHPSVRRHPSQQGRRTRATPTPAVPSPRLAPLFRSEAQGAILAHLMADPEREWSRTDLHFRTYISTTTVTSELRRAVEAGIIIERKAGRSPALFRANTEHDLFAEIRRVLLATYLPGALVEVE